MNIPNERDTVRYVIYSNSKEIDVEYIDEYFYLTVKSMSILFNCKEQTINDIIASIIKKKKLKNDKKIDNDTFDYELCYDLKAVLLIGEQINLTETNRFIDWANTTLNKYKIQNQGDSKFSEIYSSSKDFWAEIEKYMEMDPEEGISMENLTSYLKRVRASYNSFIDKLEEIEETNYILASDLEFLNSIELRYIDRKLHDSVFKEFGKDIEKTIYIATLSELISRLINYMGDWYNVPWSEKINSLKIKIIQIDIECKQMFNLIERFNYFSKRLFQNYEDIVNPTFISHFEPKFNFWDLCADTSDISDLSAKRVLFVDAKIKATKWLIEESSENDLKKECEDYIERCQQSIDLIDYEMLQKANTVDLLSKKSKKRTESYPIKIAYNKKTDFIKFISAMYDTRLFVDENGKPLSNKQKLMDTFGEFLGDDFSKYSVSLSQAKDKDMETFLRPFREIEKAAKRYFMEGAKKDV